MKHLNSISAIQLSNLRAATLDRHDPRARLLSSSALSARSLRGGAVAAGVAALVAGSCLGSVAAQAQNATWAGPGSNWSTNANWSPATVPTGTATFAGATPTTVFVNANLLIGTTQFDAGTPAYTITVNNPNS